MDTKLQKDYYIVYEDSMVKIKIGAIWLLFLKGESYEKNLSI